MADFINFEADDVNRDVIDECDPTAAIVSDNDFLMIKLKLMKI